jgi:hypothetical protein
MEECGKRGGEVAGSIIGTISRRLRIVIDTRDGYLNYEWCIIAGSCLHRYAKFHFNRIRIGCASGKSSHTIISWNLNWTNFLCTSDRSANKSISDLIEVSPNSEDSYTQRDSGKYRRCPPNNTERVDDNQLHPRCHNHHNPYSNLPKNGVLSVKISRTGFTGPSVMNACEGILLGLLF